MRLCFFQHLAVNCRVCWLSCLGDHHIPEGDSHIFCLMLMSLGLAHFVFSCVSLIVVISYVVVCHFLVLPLAYTLRHDVFR